LTESENEPGKDIIGKGKTGNLSYTYIIRNRTQDRIEDSVGKQLMQNLKQGTGYKKRRMEDRMKWYRSWSCIICFRTIWRKSTGWNGTRAETESGTGHWTREKRMEDTMRSDRA
jgi:hypothetical protein